MIRLGGPVYGYDGDPDKWASAVKAKKYTAAVCPVDTTADDSIVARFAETARRERIVIAEVGAWSNPLSPDIATRRAAIEKCTESLRLADEIGALCCVNIAGSRGDKWDGPSELDMLEETFEMIVETVRSIIDAVKPKRTRYAIEAMPWMYPDSPECYDSLLKAIDREASGVHLDPVNMINSPSRYFNNAAFLKGCFSVLGARIVSCHAKDIILGPELTVHLDECAPGLGHLRYDVYLSELTRLGRDVPLILEHLQTETEYDAAAEYVRRVADANGIDL